MPVCENVKVNTSSCLFQTCSYCCSFSLIQASNRVNIKIQTFSLEMQKMMLPIYFGHAAKMHLCQNDNVAALQVVQMCACVRQSSSISHTLCRQWWHVLVRTPVDLVSVRIHGQHQHHDASHNAPGDWTHRGALDHVQRRHLLICGGKGEGERRGKDGQKMVKAQRVSEFSRRDNKPTWRSSGSDSLLLSNQCEMANKTYSYAARQPTLFLKKTDNRTEEK